MPNRYRNGKECMEKVVTRKRVCEFPFLGLGVHCECDAAIECPAAREVARLIAERPSREDCGREERCEWKKASVEGHKAAISRAEKAEDELVRIASKYADLCKHHAVVESEAVALREENHVLRRKVNGCA